MEGFIQDETLHLEIISNTHLLTLSPMGRFSKFSDGFFNDRDFNYYNRAIDTSSNIRNPRLRKPYHWNVNFSTCYIQEHFENIINELPSYIKKKCGIFIISGGQTTGYCDMIQLGDDRFNRVEAGLNFFSISDFPEYLYSFGVEEGNGILYIKFHYCPLKMDGVKN